MKAGMMQVIEMAINAYKEAICKNDIRCKKISSKEPGRPVERSAHLLLAGIY
jgi:hypothetical protein